MEEQPTPDQPTNVPVGGLTLVLMVNGDIQVKGQGLTLKQAIQTAAGAAQALAKNLPDEASKPRVFLPPAGFRPPRNGEG